MNIFKRLVPAFKPYHLLVLSTRMSSAQNIQKHYDASQVAQFDDKCILVDSNDNQLGSVTKKECHLLENINKGMLHRAFSVFLFDSNKRLLLQQRSLRKITYPNHWSNTCCSHPMFAKAEMDETNDHIGIKRAAKRRFIIISKSDISY